MSTITIALTKGRLEEKTARLLARAGFDMTPLEQKERRLIIPLSDGLKIVLAKAADVVTYVERGACDLGIVGKDTIAERGGSFFELMDLGFGKCRFAVASTKGKTLYNGYQAVRIATKYPNITRRYFEQKCIPIEIIKIEGSVELTPLIGLADAIVDIVETGETLRANGLEIIEEIMPISARVIANTTSLKLKREQIEELLKKMEAASAADRETR